MQSPRDTIEVFLNINNNLPVYKPVSGFPFTTRYQPGKPSTQLEISWVGPDYTVQAGRQVCRYKAGRQVCRYKAGRQVGQQVSQIEDGQIDRSIDMDGVSEMILFQFVRDQERMRNTDMIESKKTERK